MKLGKTKMLILTAILASSFLTGCQNQVGNTTTQSVNPTVNNSSKTTSNEEKSNTLSDISTSSETASSEEKSNALSSTSTSSKTISNEEKSNTLSDISTSSETISTGEKNDSSYYVFEPSIDPENITASGKCGKNGNNVKWILDRFGTFTVYGSGEMQDYTIDSRPWDFCKNEIKTVFIEYGVTSIGMYAFYSCDNLSEAAVSRSVTKVGDASFRKCKNLKSISFPDSIGNITNSIF